MNAGGRRVTLTFLQRKSDNSLPPRSVIASIWRRCLIIMRYSCKSEQTCYLKNYFPELFSQEESDFDRIARTMDTPWYLKSQRDVSWDFTSSSPSVVEKRPETMMPPTTTSSVYKSNSSIYEATTAQPSCEEKKNSKLKSSAVSSNDHTSLVGSPKKSHHRHHSA